MSLSSLTSWFAANQSTSSSMASIPMTGSPSLSFDDIADRVELYQEELSTSSRALEQARIDLATQKQDNTRLQESIHRERSSLKQLRQQEATMKEKCNNLKQAVKALEARQYNRDVQLNQLKQSHDDLVKRSDVLGQKYEDTLFDLEFLKCTTAPTVRNDSPGDAAMPLVPQPFVVILVDGDAYAWSTDLFCQSAKSSSSPGAQAAIRMRNEVTRYILDQSSTSRTIPVTSKIIVRVFINQRGKTGAQNSPALKPFQKQVRSLPTFMTEFNEAMPLFDFMDVGYGKERADEKIRENFQIYISNPHCHRVFLAVCKDNGFARMLEPYRYHNVAAQKIVLVSPGYVEKEIEKLGFETLEWPTVFAKQRMPVQSQAIRFFKGAATRRQEQHDRSLGLEGTRNPVIAESVMYFLRHIQSWEPSIGAVPHYHKQFMLQSVSATNTLPTEEGGYSADDGIAFESDDLDYNVD